MGVGTEEVEMLGANGLVVGTWREEQSRTLPLVRSQEKQRQSPVSSPQGGGGDEA